MVHNQKKFAFHFGKILFYYTINVIIIDYKIIINIIHVMESMLFIGMNLRTRRSHQSLDTPEVNTRIIEDNRPP